MLPPPEDTRPPPVAPPDDVALHEAAVSHLSRYATTRAGLIRILHRRIDRWARTSTTANRNEAAQHAKRLACDVVGRLAAAGLLNDAAFAEARVRRLVRAGRSRRAVAAHLAARGVGQEDAKLALARESEATDDHELAAALVLARRRRIGPFRTSAAPRSGTARPGPARTPDTARRELGIMARAGFGRDVATTALNMATEEADALVDRMRQT